MEKLKPCPFCEGECVHESTITEETIMCTICPYKMSTTGSYAVVYHTHQSRPIEDKAKQMLVEASRVIYDTKACKNCDIPENVRCCHYAGGVLPCGLSERKESLIAQITDFTKE